MGYPLFFNSHNTKSVRPAIHKLPVFLYQSFLVVHLGDHSNVFFIPVFIAPFKKERCQNFSFSNFWYNHFVPSLWHSWFYLLGQFILLDDWLICWNPIV